MSTREVVLSLLKAAAGILVAIILVMLMASFVMDSWY